LKSPPLEASSFVTASSMAPEPLSTGRRRGAPSRRCAAYAALLAIHEAPLRHLYIAQPNGHAATEKARRAVGPRPACRPDRETSGGAEQGGITIEPAE
jgi:hypothetical protein